MFWRRFIQRFCLPRPLAVPNQGWSLLEMAIVSVIVGILSSLAIPSMMSGMGKNEVKSALGQVKGSIQEAQRAAIKNGQSCTVIINSTTLTGSPAGCISSPVTLASTITLRAESVSGSTITALSPLPKNLIFSYRGNPDNPSEWVLVISSAKTTTQSCLAIASGIGIMRSGTYSGTTCTSSF